MVVRSGGRKVSFNLLSGDISGDNDVSSFITVSSSLQSVAAVRRKKKSKSAKKRNRASAVAAATAEVTQKLGFQNVLEDDRRCDYYCDDAASRTDAMSDCAAVNGGTMVVESEYVGPQVSCISYVELRQRNVGGNGTNYNTSMSTVGSSERLEEETASTRESVMDQWRPPQPLPLANGSVERLDTQGSLDWNRLMAQDPNLLREVSSRQRSPLEYFIGEIHSGKSFRSTISIGNEKKRQRVYNTMFHIPLKCERLIIAGFFVCLDSFLSLLTIMPARISMVLWRILRTRQFNRPTAAELSDFGCLIVLALGVASLQMTDISLIYHFIRGQGTVKLYVVYNVLEIFDKLCQSFGEDVLQVLFNSAEGLANCSQDNIPFEFMRFILDETIAVGAFVVHSFVLLAQAVTLSTCIIAHNNALMALLVSNNFAEIKSNVFKRVSKDNLHNVVCSDTVERFHITAFLLFVLAQNILEAEGPWFASFLTNALLVYMCEVFIDLIKHSFLAKFNDIKPLTYSEFLEDLCKQTLDEDSDGSRKNLTFIPLAPACVVIRVLAPVYATFLPSGLFAWRLFWIFSWSALTYIILVVCKILVELGLRNLATWYLNQRRDGKQHVD